MSDKIKSIETVVAEQTDFLLSIDGVFGVAVGKTEDGASCLLVQVEQMTEEVIQKVPQEIDGYQVTIFATDLPTQF